jgi:hypothetical protein
MKSRQHFETVDFIWALKEYSPNQFEKFFAGFGLEREITVQDAI